MSEEWKQMEGHPKFFVSSEGRVADRYGKVFSQWVNHKGYAQICVCECGKKFAFRVHREIAKAFLPKVEGKDQINHKDGNKLNNRVENLEWCTAQENSVHAYRVLGHKNEPRGEKPVICVETGEEFKSLSEAARCTGLTRQGIAMSCNDGQRTCGKRHWIFKK